MPLAKRAVEETGRGVYEDKCTKNIYATEYIWYSIKKDKNVGIIHEEPHEEVIEIAEPAGGVAGMVKSAHVKRAVNDLTLSKTFDNGMICASEQAIIVDKEIYNGVKKMQNNNCYFVTEEERIKLEKLVINENTCAVNSDIVGKSAHYIASLVGIKVAEDTKILVAEIKGVGAEYPLSREEGFKYCEEMLNLGGLGHSAVIHSTNKEVQKQFGLRMKACRLIVNSPSAQAGIGDIYNAFIPSLTLGCGSYGKNSVSQNVTATHLINVKRLANKKII
ncbi:hypothetical protein COK72_31660 [Bacillus thuringiensis]|uniref:Uncharacterized protein n=1 Tax=Bacillus thuringiensis TaxID=1428 RepID=A0A9X7AGL1_BACTU|nr:hypothetical protein COK72_31660 [Bacillus thuringiensis]